MMVIGLYILFTYCKWFVRTNILILYATLFQVNLWQLQ